MSEWIKRSEQEPPKGAYVLKFMPRPANSALLSIWAGTENSHNHPFTHWMPLPAPPPRTVTIEISEEDAREWAMYHEKPSMNAHAPSHRLYAACRKALEDLK